MHYLRCCYPELWNQLEGFGMNYDASMGYADRVGFRAGTSHTFAAFDHKLQRQIDLRVVPLAVMDGTLYASSYMGIDSMHARVNKIRTLRDACRRVGGTFSLLWHNSEYAHAEARYAYLSGISDFKEQHLPFEVYP